MTEPFELSAQPERITSGELARRLAARLGEAYPVSTQTIANWVKAGRLAVAETRDGVRYFDPAVALDQAVANRSSPSHGGRRPGSGRRTAPKPAQAPSEPDLVHNPAADAAEARDAVLARFNQDPNYRPDGAVPVAELANITHDELKRLLAHVPADPVGLTQVSLERLKLHGQIKAQAREEAEAAGRLVDAEEVRHAWAGAQRAVKAELDGLPGRAAERISVLAWLSPEVTDRLIGDLSDAEVPGDLLDEVRRRLALPPDLEHRVRAVIADEIRQAAGRLSAAEA